MDMAEGNSTFFAATANGEILNSTAVTFEPFTVESGTFSTNISEENATEAYDDYGM